MTYTVAHQLDAVVPATPGATPAASLQQSMKITCNLAAADRQFVTAQGAVQQPGKQASVKHAPGAAALLAAARPALAAAAAQQQCLAWLPCRGQWACQVRETLLTATALEGQAGWAERPPQGDHL